MKIRTSSKITLAILLILSFQNIGISCSCDMFEPAFCKMVRPELNVIQVVVTDSASYLMEVNLIENLNKEISEDTLMILGQDGFNCGEWLYQFEINDTLILAVLPWEYNGKTYWYLEGSCGIHFLRHEDGMVKGQITDNLTLQPFQDFKENLFACLDMSVSTEDNNNLASQISVVPNSIQNAFQISMTQNQIDAYELYNSNGQQIKSRTLQQSANTVEVNASDLGNGIYYIRIITSKGILTRKILKM